MNRVFEKINQELKNLINSGESGLYHHNDIHNNAIHKALDVIKGIKEEYKDKYVSIDVLDQVRWERDVALSQLEELGYGFAHKIWFNCNEMLPEKDGKYLCQISDGRHDYIELLSFTKNLYKISKYDFYDKKCAGFYEYDSEWGYYDIDNVIVWCKLPKLYKGKE